MKGQIVVHGDFDADNDEIAREFEDEHREAARRLSSPDRSGAAHYLASVLAA